MSKLKLVKTQYNKEGVLMTQEEIDRLVELFGAQVITVTEQEEILELPKLFEDSISIVKVNDEAKGVRVRIFDEDFVIGLKDHPTDVQWEEACKIDTGLKKQFTLIAAYKDEINAKLVEAGGDAIGEKWYWTSAEYDGYNAWLYYATNGCLDIYDFKYYSYSVRPFLAFKYKR